MNIKIISFELNNILKQYVNKEKIDINNIPNGKGKRRTKSQRIYENRNSYYKTDKDATAMVLKEDYYSKNGHVFHAGYNIQVMVSSGIITMFGVFQNRSDYHTFIPMMICFISIMAIVLKTNMPILVMVFMITINI